jgi:hypothetical protein
MFFSAFFAHLVIVLTAFHDKYQNTVETCFKKYYSSKIPNPILYNRHLLDLSLKKAENISVTKTRYPKALLANDKFMPI